MKEKPAKENLKIKDWEKDVKKLLKRLHHRLDYCHRQNGMSKCKNCGLCEEDLELIKINQ